MYYHNRILLIYKYKLFFVLLLFWVDIENTDTKCYIENYWSLSSGVKTKQNYAMANAMLWKARIKTLVSRLSDREGLAFLPSSGQ